MKTILKWFTTIILTLCMMAPVSFAATEGAASATVTAAHSGQVQTTPISNGDTIYYRGSYHSSSRAPSSRVSGSRYSSSRSGTGYGTTYGSTGRSMFGGFGSHMFSFGAGWFFGSMFHPFGGYYGVGYHSFSLLGILIDLIIIWIIWRIVRRMFR